MTLKFFRLALRVLLISASAVFTDVSPAPVMPDAGGLRDRGEHQVGTDRRHRGDTEQEDQQRRHQGTAAHSRQADQGPDAESGEYVGQCIHIAFPCGGTERPLRGNVSGNDPLPPEMIQACPGDRTVATRLRRVKNYSIQSIFKKIIMYYIYITKLYMDREP